MDCNRFYRENRQHKVCFRHLNEIDQESKILNFWRKKNSYRGLSNLTHVTDLTATSVDEGFFNEICEMKNLDRLVMDGVKVPDISLLSNLKRLRYLKIVKLSPADNLEVLANIPSLRKLWINESKAITDYSFLRDAKKIVALGVEGDTWTKQKVDSLAPFSYLDDLEALFMSSVQLKDKNLDYLATNPKLKYFWVARFAPKSSFDSLRNLMPSLECQWCDNYDA